MGSCYVAITTNSKNMHSAIRRQVFGFNFSNIRYRICLKFLIDIAYASFMLPIQRGESMVLEWHHKSFLRRRIVQLEYRKISLNMSEKMTGYAQSEDRSIGFIFLQQLQEISSIDDWNGVRFFYASGTINFGTIMIFLCFQKDAFLCIFLCF